MRAQSILDSPLDLQHRESEIVISRRSPFEVRLWKATSYAISTRLSFLTIRDLVDALSLLASTSESKDWQSLPRPDVECIQVQGVRAAKESDD